MLRKMGLGCCVLMLTVAVGCEELDPNKKARPVLVPPGIAPIGMDASDGGRAAPPAVAPVAAPPVAAPPAGGVPVAVSPVANPAVNAPGNDSKGIIGKTDGRVVDVKKALVENPNLKVVENKTGGDDILSFVGSAYVVARSQASMLGFQAWLKQHKIVEERNPTYDEFIQAMKENGVRFSALYPWQMYGYDVEAGKMVILEDAAMKAEKYKAAGLTP
ncbi:MAG: hypothetical protein JWN70_4544 [Planctomycetaceae bacterium]|nr:hypothetical protein [Planctomycetaceae bacterium]